MQLSRVAEAFLLLCLIFNSLFSICSLCYLTALILNEHRHERNLLFAQKKNKGANQLRYSAGCSASLSFRRLDNRFFSHFYIPVFKTLAIPCYCQDSHESDLVVHPEDRFSRFAAHIKWQHHRYSTTLSVDCLVKRMLLDIPLILYLQVGIYYFICNIFLLYHF